MPVLVEPSNLSGFAGKYIGRARAFIEGRVRKKVFEIRDELLQEACPVVDRLEAIIETKDNLIKFINTFDKKVQVIRDIIEPLDSAVNTLNNIVQVLREIPVPSTIGLPPPAGGVVFSIPVGTINKLNDLLQKISFILDDLAGDIRTINRIFRRVDRKLDEVRNLLDKFDLPLIDCIKDLHPDDRDRLLELINNLPGQEPVDSDSFTVVDKKGTSYTAKIETDINGPLGDRAPLRFAVAFDDDGQFVAKGPKSFSSSTQVLLDELKFRIDNELL